jgi:hypothetical protein
MSSFRAYTHDRNRRAQAGLGGILDSYYRPELDRTQGSAADAQDAFLERLNAPTDYSGLRGELSAMAEGITSEMFGPGGAVQQATSQAAEQSVGTGFGPSSGGFDRARRNIFSGARGEVTNRIAQGALQLAPIAMQERQGDISALGDFYGMQATRGDALRDSLFGGEATIENLGMAREQLDLNRMLIEESLRQSRSGGGIGGFLKKAAGGLIGTALGGPIGGAFGSWATSKIPGLRDHQGGGDLDELVAALSGR